MTLADLRRLAELLPAGASLTLPREVLLELCGDDGAVTSVEGAGEFTAATLAERLGRNASTIRGWCEHGDLPGAYRLNGREWRIPAAAVEAFLSGQRPTPATRRRSVALGDWRKAV